MLGSTRMDLFDILQRVKTLPACFNCLLQQKERGRGGLGLLIQATSQQTIAAMLMLLEVFNCIKAMLSTFQKSSDSICLSHVETYIEITIHKLS